MSEPVGNEFPADVCPNCCRARGMDEANSDLHELVGNLRNKIDNLFEFYIELLMKYERLKNEVEQKHGNLMQVCEDTPPYYPCVAFQDGSSLNNGPPRMIKSEEIEMLKKEIKENEMQIRFLRGKNEALTKKKERKESDKQ